jgi:hypothetical protein
MPEFNQRLPEFNQRLPEFNQRLPEFNQRLPEFNQRLPEFNQRLPEFNIEQFLIYDSASVLPHPNPPLIKGRELDYCPISPQYIGGIKGGNLTYTP